MRYMGQPLTVLSSSPSFNAGGPSLQVVGVRSNFQAPSSVSRISTPAPPGLSVYDPTRPPSVLGPTPIPSPMVRQAVAPLPVPAAARPTYYGGGPPAADYRAPAPPEAHGYQANWWWLVFAAGGIGAVVLASTWKPKSKASRQSA